MRPTLLVTSLIPGLVLALTSCGDQSATRSQPVAAPSASVAAAKPAAAVKPANTANPTAAPSASVAAAKPAVVVKTADTANPTVAEKAAQTAVRAVAPVPASAASAKSSIKPGLVGAYFSLDGAIEDWPTFAADAKPHTLKIDADININSTDAGFNGTDLLDQFYVRWNGVLRAPKDGKYTIFSESDDGSRVTIGTARVVDNSGIHDMREVSGEIDLKAGDHALVVEFFENNGGAGCKLSWSVEGIDKQPIPAAALGHR